jgi:hypothetical protein
MVGGYKESEEHLLKRAMSQLANAASFARKALAD